MKKIIGLLAASLFAIASTTSLAQSNGPNDAQIAAIVVAANYLKALLVKVRPAFVAHLEHAQHMQAAFK